MNEKIISIINQKGGVGKTTTVINLAAGLSMRGKKVLVIDLDPQGNATTGLGLPNTANSELTIYSVLNGNKKITDVIQATKVENLNLITSNVDLSEFDNPSPVVAFPCGSKSITNIFLSFIARPAARLIAVVVFPTPPF